jgi:threonylcarbamoyladenosine tRNA methylthiotransferase MtaB
MRFSGIHVFPYSQRQGTLAAKMPGQVPEPAKKERVRRLIDLAEAMSADYRGRFLGSSASVLWETQRENGVWEGLTDTYIRVRGRSPDELRNRLRAARLTGTAPDGLWGEIAS